MTATLSLPTWNPALLAAELKDRNLPGQRSKTAITRLRRHRSALRPPYSQTAPGLRERLSRRLVATYSAEIRARGGETGIRTDKTRYAELGVEDRSDGLTLLHADAWRYYGSSSKPRRASLSYLCGREDGQTWAVRVPGTITTVPAAIEWITPAAVRDAGHAGRRVTRQGDVYAVETTKAHDGKGDLPDSHIWDAASRVLAHPQHGTVHLPWPVRFVTQNAYAMGRGANHAYAD